MQLTWLALWNNIPFLTPRLSFYWNIHTRLFVEPVIWYKLCSKKYPGPITALELGFSNLVFS